MCTYVFHQEIIFYARLDIIDIHKKWRTVEVVALQIDLSQTFFTWVQKAFPFFHWNLHTKGPRDFLV